MENTTPGRSGFLGLDGFVWWIGVVEDRDDPLKLGRARVRIFGWHTDNLSQLPTESLPWALAITPTNNPNPMAPLHGDWVVGFFIDGEVGQEPLILGVLPGYRSRNPNQVFSGARL